MAGMGQKASLELEVPLGPKVNGVCLALEEEEEKMELMGQLVNPASQRTWLKAIP